MAQTLLRIPLRIKMQRIALNKVTKTEGMTTIVHLSCLGGTTAYTRFPFKYMEQFREYERIAREAGKGLWAESRVHDRKR